jgi:hypothetical protein
MTNKESEKQMNTSTLVSNQRKTRIVCGDDHDRRLDAVSPYLLATLQHDGVIVLRGFDVDPTRFNRLVANVSGRITIDPAREFYGKVAQKVDSGFDPIGLHIENGATPNPPDLLWFCCVRAANEGSQTTVCDGQAVWDRLDPNDQDVFLNSQVEFSRNVTADQWRMFTAFNLGGDHTAASVTVDDLRTMLTGSPVTVTELSDGGLHYAFLTRLVHECSNTNTISWANSLFGPSYNYESPLVRFEGGSPIPEDLIERVRTITEDETFEHAWIDGDILLIDNRRMMHGRRAISDPDRLILAAQSFRP